MNTAPELAARDSSVSRRALWALVLLVPAASIGPFFAMHIEGMRGGVGQWIYFACKAWIILLPALWWLFVERKPVSCSPLERGRRVEGLLTGFGLGAAIFVVIWLTYFLVGRRLIDVEQLRAAAEANGIGTPGAYLSLALFLSFINSLVEEYVWRWFVFRQVLALAGAGAQRGMLAVVIAAFLFTIHHIVALTAQMDLLPALLASLGVFIGGTVWSWCYRRYGSIWPGYVSHVLADLAVFGVGWVLLFG